MFFTIFPGLGCTSQMVLRESCNSVNKPVAPKIKTTILMSEAIVPARGWLALSIAF